jgi:hypothetical protein
MIKTKPKGRLTQLGQWLVGAVIGAAMGAIIGVIAVQGFLDTNWSGAWFGARVGAMLGYGGSVMAYWIGDRWRFSLVYPLHGLVAGAASGVFLSGVYGLFLLTIVLFLSISSNGAYWPVASELIIQILGLVATGTFLGGVWGIILSGVLRFFAFIKMRGAA